ncbi:M24 family metallopeptidase [Candidatus Neptunichlamydia sp. REUL1]|uniref:M24 family metallopeptidase n=1 Tax=Candidatus Neptunichlamydia sp. REUL1 TaxID=3064277 RepID=UPI00292DF6DD|nr:Xaa-Pro peptidase family protein [Candidatus Neptunochlamydia sp. REUL1]
MTRSKTYFKSRLAKFRTHFSKWGVEGFVIENPTDLAYFSGLNLSRGRLLVSLKTATLFVDGRYKETAKKGSPYPVKNLKEKDFNESLRKLREAKTFGFDTSLTVAAHRELKKAFVKRSLKGVDHPTLAVRMIKDRSELILLQKSADLLWKGFQHVRKKLKVGVRESELAWEFEFYVKTLGAEALSFDPIVAFGENSALPHHHSGQRKLRRGDVVLMDMGVVLNGYASDMTRVVFFGEASKRIQEIYKLVRKAHQAALDMCKAGVPVALLDTVARESMGKEEKHFIHALGHGIGLDVHESPRVSAQSAKVILQEGMVITIEPGIYLPNVGGIRYEDMVVITKTGYRNLFKNTRP